MAYINVYVSTGANIFIKNKQLYLQNKQLEQTYPLEDVNSVIIENLQTTITTYTLSQFAKYKILCFVCDSSHLPTGVVLPFCNQYQTLTNYNYQTEIAKPLCKQLWKQIIENKIKNQNYVLKYFKKEADLTFLQESVLSGDSNNNEAKASLIYFPNLFGVDFVRRNDADPINAFLNYGYAILRGFIARSIVAHGLMPFIGIFHANQFNQFNLADDLIEVFRPVVDMYVAKNFNSSVIMNSLTKAQIYNLVNCNILVDGNKYSISYAIELFVQSFQKSLKEGKNCLKTISLLPIEVHEYE